MAGGGVLLITSSAIMLGLWMTAAVPPAPRGAESVQGGDLELLRLIIEQMRDGASYYAAAHGG
jgi:hypothetical protein